MTTEKLDELAAGYRGSAEEDADLRAAYTKCKGSMGAILDEIMHATAEDEGRFREKLEGWVRDGSLRRYKAFTSEPDAKKRRRQANAAKEAEEADELAKELGVGGKGGAGGDLTAAIVARQASRQSGHDAMLSSLAARFAEKDSKQRGGSKKGGKAAAADPLDDAAFEAARQKMLAGKSKGKR